MGYVRRENNLNDIAGNATEPRPHILTAPGPLAAAVDHTAGNFLNQFNFAYDKATQGTARRNAPGQSCVLEPARRMASSTSITKAFAYLGAALLRAGRQAARRPVHVDDATLRDGEHTLKFGGQLNFMSADRRSSTSFNRQLLTTSTRAPRGTSIHLRQQPKRRADQRLSRQPSLKAERRADRSVRPGRMEARRSTGPSTPAFAGTTRPTPITTSISRPRRR